MQLEANDPVVITGITGGVGVYMGQVAKAFGAKPIVGLARNEEKLKRALTMGADYVINTRDKDFKAIQDEFRGIAKQAGIKANVGWKIFECQQERGGYSIGSARFYRKTRSGRFWDAEE